RSQRAEANRPRLRAGPRFGTRPGTGPIQRTHRAPRGRTGPCRRRRRRLHRPTVSPGRQRVLYASLVAKATEKIDALLARLEQSGADPQRLDALRRTQRFKRSWVDLAQTLVEIRRSASFQAWGYDDFYAYCTQELFLKRPTVDKLTMSFSTLQRLAPSVLQWDGVEREIPSYQAVDYFGRAMGQSGATIRAAAGKADVGGRAANDPAPVPPPPREVIKELRHAVFDEGQSVAELRRRFDPILHPKPAGAEQL